MLFRGQSEVESSFNVNENALVNNMQMEIIVAQRKVNEYMRKIIFNLIICQCQTCCYKTPSKLTSGIKNLGREAKSKEQEKHWSYRNRKRNSWLECSEKSA